ncbi:MAG TPA: mycothiol synthase [Mycobacteriales bacterium]|nr:mycothiol synthase [Mycobacteriales bacterium]HWC34220.1 mycothiol synthase [Mycobacteriales bacterium]
MAVPQVVEVPALTDEQAGAVLRLRDDIARTAGASPLSDHVVSAVRARAPGRHFVQKVGDRLVGFARLETNGEHPVAELLFGADGDPAGLVAVVGDAAGSGLRIWTRGDTAVLNDVLPPLGYELTRTLLQLRRGLDEPLPDPVWPAGVTVRTFRVGADEAEWLAVNNAAFAGHPEQSGWTPADIAARETEGWFDPLGFFLAESEGAIVGFHWTKVHDEDLGEVYVIGVDPSMQGRRLGEPLLLQGLRHLRDSGRRTVLLYVESDNHSALRLYERLGFTRWDADRMFTRSN